jgi:hypothetical protein
LVAQRILSSTDLAAATAQQRLEMERDSMQQQIFALTQELHETRIQAMDYAKRAVQDSRHKAEQALNYQHATYERAHEEYATIAKDICQSEVAHYAQNVANQEAHDKQLLEAESRTALLNQQIAASQQQASLRTTLIDEAQESHERIMHQTVSQNISMLPACK